MPRYEFMCEKCDKPFEVIMTFSEREKVEVIARSARAGGPADSAVSWHRPRRRTNGFADTRLDVLRSSGRCHAFALHGELTPSSGAGYCRLP